KQWGQAVVGAELSYTWADLAGTSSSSVIVGATRTSELNNLFLATVRLGATWQNMLAYGKGGYASADVAMRTSAADTFAISSSGREQGWVAGLGFEYGIRPDIIIGVEYDFIHLDFGTREIIQTLPIATSITNGGVDVQTLLARLTFKFEPHWQ